MKKRLGLIGAIGFGVAALFIGVAAAQTNDGSTTTDPPAAEQKRPAAEQKKRAAAREGDGAKAGQVRAHKMRAHGMKHGMGPGIHGEFTVADGNGGWKTIATQFGEVTAVSNDSITVKSEDGFTKTYVVTEATRVGADGRDGIADIATGDKVGVSADVNGDTATATHIHERRAKPDPDPAPAPAPAE